MLMLAGALAASARISFAMDLDAGRKHSEAPTEATSVHSGARQRVTKERRRGERQPLHTLYRPQRAHRRVGPSRQELGRATGAPLAGEGRVELVREVLPVASMTSSTLPSPAPPTPSPPAIDSPRDGRPGESAVPRGPARLRRARPRAGCTCPATRAAPAADPELREAIGERALAHGHPGAHLGHRHRPDAHALRAGAGAGGRGLGRRAQLVPDQRRVAGQPRGPAHARARRRPGRGAAQRALEHRRRLHPRRADAHASSHPRSTPSWASRTAWRPRRSTRRSTETPGRGGRHRRVAHLLRRGGRRGRPGRGRALARGPAGGGRGLGRAPGLPRRPARRTRSRCGADMVVSSTHKIVGSLTQSAMVHLGRAAEGRIDAQRGGPRGHAGGVHEPQLAAGRLARRRPPAGGHARATSCWARRSRRWPRSRARGARDRRASTCSTSGCVGAPGRARLRPAAAGDRRARHRRQRLRARRAAARARRGDLRAGRART